MHINNMLFFQLLVVPNLTLTLTLHIGGVCGYLHIDHRPNESIYFKLLFEGSKMSKF